MKISPEQLEIALLGKKIKSVVVNKDETKVTLEIVGGVKLEIEAGEDVDSGYQTPLQFLEIPKPPRPLRKGDHMTMTLANGRVGVYKIIGSELGHVSLEFVGFQDQA